MLNTKYASKFYISAVILIMIASFLLAYLPRTEKPLLPSRISQISVFEDTTGKLTIDSVRHRSGSFISQDSSTVFRKRSLSTFWIRCTLDAARTPSEFRYMEFDCSSMEELDVYFDDNQVIHAGKKVDVRSIPVKSMLWYIPIPADHNPSEPVYIRFHSSTILRVPMRVVDVPTMMETTESTMIAFGLMFGVLLAIFALNFFSFFILRKRVFLTYALYLFFLILYHFRVHGFQYFIPEPYRLFESSVWISLAGVGIFMTLFAKQFMNLKQRLPFINGLLNGAIVAFIVQMIVGVFLSSFYANEIAYITGMIVPILIMGTVVYLVTHGHPELKYYLLAWCAMLSATVIWATMPYAKTYVSPNILFMAGTSLDSLLFTFSIFAMLRQDLKEKDDLKEREKYYISLSRTDALTGLYNRRYLSEIVKQMEAENEMPPESALIMLDLDNFKSINDTYGHLVGDIILTQTGAKIKLHIRHTDIACRYGGDEFLVLLPGAKLENAQTIAEEILKEIVEQSCYSETGEEIHTSVSIGLTETRPDDSFDGMFLRADAALYQAKKLGRNRISVL